MDHDQAPLTRGSIPRLSKLPTPRASNDNLRSNKPIPSREDLYHDNHSKLPGLSRPSSVQQYRVAAPSPSPLGESINRSIRSRFGWSQGASQSRQKSPVRDAIRSFYDTSLETTPPSSTAVAPLYENGNENALGSEAVVVDENATSRTAMEKEKRRPRPSLSERTMETLSQISPSPSPARRRSSVHRPDSAMGPPSRPTSSMKNSRPNTAQSSRPMSPSKKQFRPPGASSPIKEVTQMPAAPSSIYTPPKAFMREKTIRITKPLRETRRSASNVAMDSHHQTSHHNSAAKPASQTVRIRPTYNSKTVAETAVTPRPSLSMLFKDPPEPGSSSLKIEVSSLEKKPGLMRPRSFGENTIAPSASSSTLSAQSQSSRRSSRSSVTEPDTSSAIPKPAKSSAALRETIARAKAEAAKKVAVVGVTALGGAITESPIDIVDLREPVSSEGNRDLLTKRVQGATTTGHLNIAAMSLKQIPDEVMKMYDIDSSSGLSWAETVDLVKLVAADNELTQLRHDAFPDWSADEVADDETKTNQFGGLEVLDFHSNMLKSIPIGLRRLERLHTLNLSQNQLNQEAMTIVCQIKSLKELLLANNTLFGTLTPEIGQLESLQVLDLRGNNLEELPSSIEHLTSLRVLKVSKNKLSRLPLEALAMLPLMEIDAANNKLTGTLVTETMPGMPTLRRFDISFNSLEQFTSLELVPFPALQTLAADHNRFSRFPDISSWKDLSTLTVSENLLTELPVGFTDLVSLKNSDFSQNNIKVIPEAVALMENLGSLNLAGNPLRERKYLTMSTENLKDDLRKRLAQPEMITSGTGIPTATTTDRPHLLTTPESSYTGAQPAYLYTPTNGTLDLTSKDLTTLSLDTIAFTPTTIIKTLKISSTHLAHFPLNLLTHPAIQPNLQHLDLSHNPLHANAYLTSPLSLPSLLTLNIVSTGLTSLDALTTHLHAPKLNSLNISCHRLAGHVPWLRALAFPSLRVLLATDNWFSSLDVEAVRGLDVLDVKNNEIDALPPKIGMLASRNGKVEEGKLRVFEVAGNRFRVPRLAVVEKGTEAVLRDLRRMIPLSELDPEWKDEV